MGRTTIDNIADLNADARIATLRAHADQSKPHAFPLLWTLDLLAAFPALARLFIHEATVVAALPRQVAAFGGANWANNAAHLAGLSPR